MLISKQGKKAAEWLSEKCEVMISDEYVNYVKNEIGKLTEEQKKRLLDKLL
jgi:Zn-finger protein